MNAYLQNLYFEINFELLQKQSNSGYQLKFRDKLLIAQNYQLILTIQLYKFNFVYFKFFF